MILPKNALFIQLRRIGDILMCTPSVRAFREAYPDCKLDFLTEFPEVLQGNPHINTIIEINKAKQSDIGYQYTLIKKIRNSRYDLIVDFFANPRSAYYSFFSAAAHRLSYGFGHRRWAYNIIPRKPDSPIYAALDKLILLEAIGVKSDNPKLEFYPSKADRLKVDAILPIINDKPLISISPVSRRHYRRWPMENYAWLADRLISRLDAIILILAGPGEEKTATEMANLMEKKPLIPDIKSLGTLGAVFERVTLHIGNDNGPKHIAVACGAPTFAIFGPENPISWTYPDKDRHGWIKGNDLCENCDKIKAGCDASCIRNVSAESALDKITEMINFILVSKSPGKKSS